MQTLKHAPLFKVALAFLAGILLADTFGCIVPIIGLAALPVYGIFVILDKHILSLSYEWMLAICIFLSAMGAGGAVWCMAYTLQSNQVEMINCQEVEATGIILSEIKETPYGRKAHVSLIGYADSTQLHPLEGKLMLSIPNTIDTVLAQYDSIVFRAYITNVRSIHWGYLNYLSRKGIHHVGYVSAILPQGKHTNLESVASACQRFFVQSLVQNIHDSDLQGIAMAMFLGDKSSLNKRIREHFTHAGLSHVLAISGLHVGIIYMVLNFLLSPLHLIRHGKRLKHVLILLFLLGYMMITGATPAVIRAVLMFGSILVFRIWYQRYHMLNLIAISAIIQLVYDPVILFQISFQLSYSAVIGIVLILPFFEENFYTQWPLLNKLYAWIGVTCAATICTLPLVLFYFGQFPTYFLLSNVMVALLTAGVVMIGFLTVLFGSIPYLGTVLGFCCEISLKALYIIVEWVATLPHAVITEISWNEPGLGYLMLQLGVAGAVLMVPRCWVSLQRRRGAKEERKVLS